MAIYDHITVLSKPITDLDTAVNDGVKKLGEKPGDIAVSSKIQADSGLRSTLIQALSGLIKKESDDVASITQKL